MSVSSYSKEMHKLQKALAFEVAKNYCKSNNLSVEKLGEQRFQIISDAAYFLQPGDAKPNGLLNDLETVPFPTLIIKANGDGLKVETTEYTEKYLKMQ